MADLEADDGGSLMPFLIAIEKLETDLVWFKRGCLLMQEAVGNVGESTLELGVMPVAAQLGGLDPVNLELSQRGKRFFTGLFSLE
jgi:hypothetical protein